jgi:hypothetical protein
MRKFTKRELMAFLFVILLYGITLINCLLLLGVENLPDHNDYRDEISLYPKTSAQSVSPTQIGQYTCTNPTGVYVFGNTTYVARWDLDIINTTDPTNPDYLGSCPVGGARDVFGSRL